MTSGAEIRLGSGFKRMMMIREHEIGAEPLCMNLLYITFGLSVELVESVCMIQRT